MKDIWNVVEGLKPAILMVVVQIAFAGVNVLYKITLNDGMSLRVVVAYRLLFAAAFMVPLALIVERKKRPKMTWTVLFQGFLCGLFGAALSQNLYLEAMSLTSATFTSATSNLTPGITFIMTVSFGLERLNRGTAAGKAKIFGTLIGIGGAMLLTFFKGPQIDFLSTHANLLHHQQYQNGHVVSSHPTSRGDTLLGALYAIGSALSYSLWLIIQTKMSERYPCYYSSTAMTCASGALFSVVYAVWLERDWSQWKLGWNLRLLTVAYAGIVGSGVTVTVMSWCVNMRGPLFVCVFSPLMVVLVAIASSLTLNESLHLGSLIGGMLIVVGLYTVLWGKGKEMKGKNQLVPSESSNESHIVEIVVGSNGDQDKSNQNSNYINQEARNELQTEK